MRYLRLIFLLLFINNSLFGQKSDTWVAFWNQEETLIGFKDKNGVVKIGPKFSGFTSARKFDDIIAVTEDVDGYFKNYYLTRNGKIVGRDSLHIFDNGADCESEGFIRFRDKASDKVGLFNAEGKVVVPAEYNDLTRVRNGMVVGLKGAERKCLDQKHTSGCEHFTWTGGKEVLIDTANRILINDFKLSRYLNFSSRVVSAAPSNDPVRNNYVGVNGKFYSFIDFDKEFRQWLKTALLENLSKKALLNASYSKVMYWKESVGNVSESARDFIDRNYALIKEKLLQLNLPGCEYNIFDMPLIVLTPDLPEYDKYHDNCMGVKDWVYPAMDVVIDYRNKKDLMQDSFEFLRTDDGYKLVGVTIRKGALK